MSSSDKSVAVIIPCFNSEGTIGETLQSVCSQTYQNLEIIVVNDGSTDRSIEIVEGYARSDRRISIINQQQAGVAAARNRGAAHATSDLLAFVDADDLWSRRKIELQAPLLSAAEPEVALAYCWSIGIDTTSRCLRYKPQFTDEGRVLQQMCRNNLLGNGSGLMVRRSAYEAVGGFDSSLRQRRAQGCEDWQIGLRFAERYKIKVAPHYLVGYRQHLASMSHDALQMVRSAELVLHEYKSRYPWFAPELRANVEEIKWWLAYRAASEGNLTLALGVWRQMVMENSLDQVKKPASLLVRYLKRIVAGRVKNASRQASQEPTFLQLF